MKSSPSVPCEIFTPSSSSPYSPACVCSVNTCNGATPDQIHPRLSNAWRRSIDRSYIRQRPACNLQQPAAAACSLKQTPPAL
jgi:hypothetical protein